MGFTAIKLHANDYIVSTSNPLPVTTSGSGVGYASSVSFTRPANTTQYTAGDAVGIADATVAANAGSAIHTFANIGPAGGTIIITDLKLAVNVAAIPSGMTTFRLELYNASPDAILDNAAWDLSSAGDRGKWLATIQLGAPVDKGSTLIGANDNVMQRVKLASGSTSLYGILITEGTFTPTSGAVKKISLGAIAA